MAKARRRYSPGITTMPLHGRMSCEATAGMPVRGPDPAKAAFPNHPAKTGLRQAGRLVFSTICITAASVSADTQLPILFSAPDLRRDLGDRVAP